MSSVENVCPVVRVIKEIRGAGIYADDAENNVDRVIKIGGNENNVEFVFDDMSFYIMSRKMDFARFELSRPSRTACEAKYNTMFHDIVDYDYTTLYTRIIDKVFNKKYLYNQFVRLIDLFGDMEELIAAKVDNMGRQGKPINISLPDMFLLPHVDQIIIYRPDILAETINKIIDYANKININALLNDPLKEQISKVDKFTGKSPVMSTRIEKISPATAEEFISGMKKILEQELEVAAYIREIESYQCKVINHMNSIYDLCRKIIARLV